MFLAPNAFCEIECFPNNIGSGEHTLVFLCSSTASGVRDRRGQSKHAWNFFPFLWGRSKKGLLSAFETEMGGRGKDDDDGADAWDDAALTGSLSALCSATSAATSVQTLSSTSKSTARSRKREYLRICD
jgi:hypothetical protein